MSVLFIHTMCAFGSVDCHEWWRYLRRGVIVSNDYRLRWYLFTVKLITKNCYETIPAWGKLIDCKQHISLTWFYFKMTVIYLLLGVDNQIRIRRELTAHKSTQIRRGSILKPIGIRSSPSSIYVSQISLLFFYVGSHVDYFSTSRTRNKRVHISKNPGTFFLLKNATESSSACSSHQGRGTRGWGGGRKVAEGERIVLKIYTTQYKNQKQICHKCQN